MAKWGEGDPRWIVEERPDATNVNNWHWTEKNADNWSKKKIKVCICIRSGCMIGTKHLTLIIRGGAKWPTANLNDYCSATEYPIGLKPSCIFKFVRCPEVYEKKLIILDRGGTLEGLLSARVPQNQPRRVYFRVSLGGS